MKINMKLRYLKCLIFDKTKWINCIITKNANLLLGYLNIIDLNVIDKNSINRNNIWNKLVNTSFRNFNFINLKKYENYKRFVVYRDPFERMLSLYKYFHTRIHDNICQKNKLNPNLKPKEFIESYIKLGLNGDDIHFIPQYFITETFKPDLIVPIEKLEKFIKEELHIENTIGKYNESNPISKDLEDEFKKYSYLIYDAYKEDLEILNRYNVYS